MKKLIFVNGTMGAGKTTVCRLLRDRLAPCAFLDGDWCWDMAPFSVTEENKTMVMDNIAYLLRSFLNNSSFEHVLFCWVMQDAAIAEHILERLQGCSYKLYFFTLLPDEDTLRARLEKDVRAGLRTADVIPRSIARLPLYQNMTTEKIEVSRRTAQETALLLERLVRCGQGIWGI